MKYRITTRGWIVFPIVGILAVTLIFFIITGLFDENKTETIENNSDMSTSDIIAKTMEDDTEVVKSTTDEVDLENDDTAEVTSEEVLEENSSNEENGITENTTENDTTEDTNNNDSTENDTTENTSNNDISELAVDMEKTSNILFNKNVFDLTNISIRAIEEWSTIMTENKDLQIVIEGHINGYPYYEDGKFGLALAQSRAQVISNYLIDQGISKDRITVINMGSTSQVDESKDLTKHYLNRRSVIYINKP